MPDFSPPDNNLLRLFDLLTGTSDLMPIVLRYDFPPEKRVVAMDGLIAIQEFIQHQIGADDAHT